MNTSVRFVLDGSVALAWLFADEQDPYADAIIARLPGIEMIVPQLWHLEVANVLAVSERRGRCTPADTAQWLGFLAKLPIVVDDETQQRAWTDTLALARQHGLTLYDAAYLELAVRENLPLASLDKQLKVAAKAIGVSAFQP
jgi:predicted nucleic acid-binding protein